MESSNLMNSPDVGDLLHKKKRKCKYGKLKHPVGKRRCKKRRRKG